MDTEFLSVKMEIHTKEILKMTTFQVKERIYGRMVESLRAYG